MGSIHCCIVCRETRSLQGTSVGTQQEGSGHIITIGVLMRTWAGVTGVVVESLARSDHPPAILHSPPIVVGGPDGANTEVELT